ncbi:hypothetical protein BABINDRAFT_170370 [Babjeviella inositovora NRRL Y-12698]|uniref:Dihydrodipicolinate synthase n=1 Tax=Babjeviella inositovora NRRL Y-12698 TaxID=984486 RepID=A0A1E3QVI6_9ASCO|nr:uncharacterized protein BABINDRAFT_170370 [Babjeviella inositovora NRRL Y-12698]ODQ81669.1 hypothetical protein BABINDRAFT_170370 [Babjeviella inositovora NRRL Y-12698]
MTSSAPAPGIYTPVPTVFPKDNETIDYAANLAHVQFLHQNGIHGFVVMGSIGENTHLEATERYSVVKNITSNISGLPSLYNWNTKVSDGTVLPVLVYIYPGVSNNTHILPKTVVRISKHKNIVGCKFSYDNVAHCTTIASQMAGEDFHVYNGLGHAFLSTLVMECHGTIDGISGVFPRIYVNLWDHKRTKLQRVASKCEEKLCEFGIISIKRTYFEVVKVGVPWWGRAPLNHDQPQGT